MEQKLIDTDRQIKLLTKKLVDEEKRFAAPTVKVKSQHKKEEQELINYASAIYSKEEERLDAIIAKENELKLQILSCKERITSAVREIENCKLRAKQVSEEDAKVFIMKIAEEENKKSDYEREFKYKYGEIDALEKKRIKHKKLKLSYSQFLKNMKIFATCDILVSEKSELEQLMDPLGRHYNKIKATSINEIRKKFDSDITMEDLVKKSDEELTALEIIPADLKFEKSDLRYEVFIKVWEIILDNISIRKELNSYTNLLNKQVTDKLNNMDKPANIIELSLEKLKTLKPIEFERMLANTQVLLDVPEIDEPEDTSAIINMIPKKSNETNK